MAEKDKATESGRSKKGATFGMVDFLNHHQDPRDQTARNVASTILKSTYPTKVALRLTDPNPPHEEVTKEIRAQIGTLFADLLENIWEISKYPDLPKWRMKNTRWAISEVLGSHQIGEKLTEADKEKISEGLNHEKPFQIGVAAGILLQHDQAATTYIRGKNERIVVPSEEDILTRIYTKLIVDNNDLSMDDKEFFRLLLVDSQSNPQVSINVEEDEVFQELSGPYNKKLRESKISLRRGIASWVQWALISTRMKATTGKQIDELGKEIIPFFRGRGKKIKSGRIRSGKLKAIKDSILTRSNPLVAGAINREIIAQLKKENDGTK